MPRLIILADAPGSRKVTLDRPIPEDVDLEAAQPTEQTVELMDTLEKAIEVARRRESRRQPRRLGRVLAVRGYLSAPGD